MTSLPASTQELLHLPSVPLSARGELPQCPGVYFILDGSTVLYVGKSVNLAQRWVAHHRLRQVESMARYPRIAWMELGEAALLEEVERALIHHFEPLLNGRVVPGEMRDGRAKVGAYIDPELKEALERLAALESRSVSNLVELLIKDAVSKAQAEGRLKP